MSAAVSIRFDHVGLMVDDADAAVEWYTRNLGLTVRDRWQDDEIGMKWAHLVADGVTLEIVERRGLDAPAESAAGFHHLAVAVDSAEQATRALEAAGGTVVFEPSYFARHDMDWAFVKDPFGNVIEVISYRSRR